MDADAVARAVDSLVALRRAPGSLASLPDDCRPADLGAAYDVQEALDAALGPRAGFKIGCTNKVMQDYLGVDHPCAGGILAADVHRGEAWLPFAAFNHVGVECEIAVTLGDAIPARDASYSAEDVAAHVAACHAAIEVVDARFPDFERVDLATMVADDFYNAAAVVGEPVTDWRALDLAALSGRMILNGTEKGSGVGAQLLDHPLNALAWLANHRSERGRDIPAGSLVLLGSLVTTRWAAAGDEVTCEIDGLGSARVAFAS